MTFWGKIFKRSRGAEGGFTVRTYSPDLLEGYDTTPLKISTVFACIDAISSDIAKMPLEPYYIDEKGIKGKAYNDATYNLLNNEPNERTTRFTFIKTLVISTLTKGNGFAYIRRGVDGVAESLTFVPADDVQIIQDAKTKEIKYYYIISQRLPVEFDDMIHLLNFSEDGVVGVSTLTYASNTIGLTGKSEKQALKSFETSISGILSTESPYLTTQQREALRKEWETRMTEQGSGLAILSGGMQYQKISLNTQESQLLESRAFNVPEICRFFRVSPVKVGDLSKSSYSTVEATNIAYLLDTLSPYMEKIEQEFRRKIYPKGKRSRMKIEFDTSALLRADSGATAQLYSSLFPLGAITTNELRNKYNLPPVDGGDTPFIMVNTLPLGKMINNNGDEQQGDEDDRLNKSEE